MAIAGSRTAAAKCLAMKIVIDMNLSPLWVQPLQSAGFDAVHWSTVGAASASDREITAWAKNNGAVIFTNDLDFSAILAASQANAPSVLQLRTQDLLPDRVADLVISVLRQFETELASGALVSVDTAKARVRILPL
jgi:predicted nuclease of predicted toxin-antitoxin system